MSIKNIIYDAVTNSLKLLSRRSDQPSVVIPLTPGQLMPVGSIIQSIMTEAEFQAEAGTSWILMDGRSIVGSKLARIKSISVIPNASGRFLRTAGGNAAALAVAQGQATAQNGLQAINNPVTSQADSPDHTHNLGYGANVTGGSIATPSSFGGGSSAKSGFTSTNHWHSVTSNVTLSSADTETRPVNLTVNTFIKIN
jgi:hypothetical protein